MKKSDQVTTWGMITGLFFTTIGSTWYLSGTIARIDERLIRVEKIVEDIPKMETDITEMQVKLDVLWRVDVSKSPSSAKLTDAELNALKLSGVDLFMDEHYSEILSKVRKLKPDNVNQAQELLISVVGRYKKTDESRDILYRAGISSGYDIDSLLVIAALSIRDKIVADLGFPGP